jgi:hypothetical protein
LTHIQIKFTLADSTAWIVFQAAAGVWAMASESKVAPWIVKATWTSLRYILVLTTIIAMAVCIRYWSLPTTGKSHLRNFVVRLFDLSLAAMSKTRLGFVLENLVGVILGGLVLFICLRLFFPKADWVEQAKNSALAILVGLVVSLLLMGGTFFWKSTTAIYDDHSDMAGRLKSVINERNDLRTKVSTLENKSCPVCPVTHPVPITPAIPPRALTELQRAILARDLQAGVGLTVRINAIGKLKDTQDFADELRIAFSGWQIESTTFAAAGNSAGIVASELEFVIPQPEDRAVQIAIHAFDHAHIVYTKNVDPNAFRGHGIPVPALTINVRDR